MKEIRLILLLITLTFAFNACSDDDDDDNFNYQETMAKYENTSFQTTVNNGSGIYTFTLNINEMYELNGETRLSVTHTRLVGASSIGYDKSKKTFILLGVFKYDNNPTYNPLQHIPIEFIDDNTIQWDGYTTYTRLE